MPDHLTVLQGGGGSGGPRKKLRLSLHINSAPPTKRPRPDEAMASYQDELWRDLTRAFAPRKEVE